MHLSINGRYILCLCCTTKHLTTTKLVRADCVRCPWAAGINVGGHYKWHFSLSLLLLFWLIANSHRRGCWMVLCYIWADKGEYFTKVVWGFRNFGYDFWMWLCRHVRRKISAHVDGGDCLEITLQLTLMKSKVFHHHFPYHPMTQ